MRPTIIPPAKSAIPSVATKFAHRRGWLNMGLGVALMKDWRVTVWTKLAALGAGAAVTFILVGLEVPLEALVGLMVPLLGVAVDVAFDGLEILIFPALLSLIFIRWFAPNHLVDEYLSPVAATD